MKRFRITKDMIADGVPLKSGDVIAANEIEAGCLESMAVRGYAVETAEEVPLPPDVPVPEPVAPPVEVPAPAPVPPPHKKK